MFVCVCVQQRRQERRPRHEIAGGGSSGASLPGEIRGEIAYQTLFCMSIPPLMLLPARRPLFPHPGRQQQQRELQWQLQR